MSPPAPRITVITATYNRANVLRYSIGSALRQTFQDFEHLVVGDGCTDETAQVVESLGDPRVRFISLPVNSGHQSAPNNAGLREARGEYIAYLGHDDLWLPHHLATLVAALDGGADLAYCAGLMVGPDASQRRLSPEHLSYQPGDWIPPSTLLHRRSLTEEAGGWPLYQDMVQHPETALWSRAHAAGRRFQLVPRLSAIKFPAAWAANVYRERPERQQAEWTERLLREPALEAEELVRFGLSQTPASALGVFARRAVAKATARVAGIPLVREWFAGRTVGRLRAFKGLKRT